MPRKAEGLVLADLTRWQKRRKADLGRRSLEITRNEGTWLSGDDFGVHLLTLFICKMGMQTQRVYVLH